MARAATIVSAQACLNPSMERKPRRRARRSDVRPRLQRRIPVAGVHIRMTHLDAMFLRVPHDLGGGVEAHRLAVQQTGREDVRVEAFHPGRDIDEEGEGAGVALRKAVFAEALDLVEAVLGEVGVVAALRSSARRSCPRRSRWCPCAGRWPWRDAGRWPPRRELRRLHGDLHRLFLKQGHAQGLVEHVLQLVRVAWSGAGMRIVDAEGARPPSPPPVVRPGASDRDGPCRPGSGRAGRSPPPRPGRRNRAAAAAAASPSAPGSRPGRRPASRPCTACRRPRPPFRRDGVPAPSRRP